MNLALLNIGTQEMVLIVIVILFLFGGKKLPELARGLGRGIREFKDASEGIKREISDQINNFEKDLDMEEPTSRPTAPTTPSATSKESAIPADSPAKSAEDKAPLKATFPQFMPPVGTYQHNPGTTSPHTSPENADETDYEGERLRSQYYADKERPSVPTSTAAGETQHSAKE